MKIEIELKLKCALVYHIKMEDMNTTGMFVITDDFSRSVSYPSSFNSSSNVNKFIEFQSFI